MFLSDRASSFGLKTRYDSINYRRYLLKLKTAFTLKHTQKVPDAINGLRIMVLIGLELIMVQGCVLPNSAAMPTVEHGQQLSKGY